MSGLRWFGLILAVHCVPSAFGEQLGHRAAAASPAATVRELESSARAMWDRAEALLANGPPEESLDLFRLLIDTEGERFIARSPDPGMPAGFQRYTSVRELAWIRIARLSQTAPELFAALRRQQDPQADRWFQTGAGERHGASDQRIVDQLIFSRLGDDALLRLGDAALERGAFNTARRHWERIAPGLRFVSSQDDPLHLASNRPLWLPFAGTEVSQSWPRVAPIFAAPIPPSELIYPDTDLNVAEIRARLVLASMLEGNFRRGSVERELLRQMTPDATGTLAGRTGKLVELLAAVEAEARNWQPLPKETEWTTFAGCANRNPALPEIAWRDQAPLWSVPLPRWSVEQEALSGMQARVAEHATGLLPYFPVVSGGLAIVQTGLSRDHVQAYRLRTGEPTLPALDAPATIQGSFDRRSVLGVPRFVPAVQDSTLFLCDGLTHTIVSGEPPSSGATLVAIDLSSDRRLQWEFALLSGLSAEGLRLAGPPVVAGPRLLIALRKHQGVREELHVAAVDVRDGRLLWQQFLGVAEPFTTAAWSRITHQMLSVDQDTVYCNSNAGLVAALQVETGRIQWITGYPRIALDHSDPDRNALHFYRDLNPCLVYRDVVIVAPTDSNRLFALDATTGIPLWVTPAELAADAVHLLAAVDDRVVVSGECVYWLDIDSGRLVGQYPGPFRGAAGFARPVPRGYGRGIRAGQHLYWPTRESVLVFDMGPSDSAGSDWRPKVLREIALGSRGVPSGNLVLANGTLLIAGADRLTAFDVRSTH